MKKYDFVAIGDTVMDAFIRLNEAEVRCDADGKNCKLCVDFGAKVPFESVTELPAVGNSPNASVAAARLGLTTALITNLGKDMHGSQSVTSLTHDGVDTSFVTIHEGKKTNYHYVLWYADDRTILINHESYEYTLPNFGEPTWVYLSSLGGNTIAYHDAIADYLEAHPTIKLAFQPGTFQLKTGLDRLVRLYARTEVFVCNVEEAQGLLSDQKGSVSELLRRINYFGPKIVVITDGKKGAYLLYENKTYFMPPYPDQKLPLERTGAGDAFASTFASMLALGKTPLEAIRYAPINSMSVVQYVGAQAGLLALPELEALAAAASENYQLQEIV